ncbi:MAG: hypothetical protein H0U72_13770 [Nitrosospira sp.]|nr:hypothetical protein [Nitrosospira sp.]
MRVLLVALMVGFGGNAWCAEELTEDGWLKVSKDEETTHYMAPGTVRVVGQNIRVWELADIKEARDIGKLQFRSVMFYSEDDCKEARQKVIMSIFFTGNMGRGVPIHASVADKWEPVGDETSRSGKRWRIVCSKLGERIE